MVLGKLEIIIMKIAIHHTPGSFSDRWIEYCMEKSISYKIVNAYDNDIIQQVEDCDVFMWHHHHANYKDALFAKQLLYSLQMAGKKVFPDFNTGWHFDDKVGEKYMLEAIGAPLVPSYVFYAKKDALKWVEQTSFPKVFKLRGGAGASNVRLVYSKSEAKLLINQAFGRGFSQFNRLGYIKDRYKKLLEGKDSFIAFLKSFVYLFMDTEFSKMHPREKGYVYFQEFIPNNSFDLRIVVVGDKAFGLKRLVRSGDFRASGSGNIIYDKKQISEDCIKIAFAVADKLKCQSVAFDFVFDGSIPLIIETSYGYAIRAYDECEGYWDKNMKWHEGTHFNICGWMIENVINS